MADKLRLSAAEIVYLLSTLDRDSRSRVPELFGLTDPERTAAMAEAGLGSLMLRGLVVADEHRAQLAPDVAAVGAGLVFTEHCVQIGLIADGRSDAAVLFATPATRFLVISLPHRTFELTGLDATQPLAEPLTALMRQFLRTHQPGAVSMVFGPATSSSLSSSLSASLSSSPESRRRTHTIVASTDSQDRWSLALGARPEATGLTAEEAIIRFRAVVDEITADESSRPAY